MEILNVALAPAIYNPRLDSKHSTIGKYKKYFLQIKKKKKFYSLEHVFLSIRSKHDLQIFMGNQIGNTNCIKMSEQNSYLKFFTPQPPSPDPGPLKTMQLFEHPLQFKHSRPNIENRLRVLEILFLNFRDKKIFSLKNSLSYAALKL